jgi:ABC-2 type transport system permease protein
VYLLLGVVMWTFFTEATNNGLQSIIARGDLIRKINFPKYIIVISGTISALINLGFNLLVVLVFILFSGVQLSFESLLVIPLILELYVFALGLAFFLAALNVKFRDAGYLWEIFLQAAFYATPIQDIRYVLVTHDSVTLYHIVSHWYIIAIPFVIVAFSVVVGGLYFKKHSKYFAETI